MTILLFIGVLRCGNLALLRAFCQWKIDHHVNVVLSFSFLACNQSVARSAQRDHAPSKILIYLVVLCFGRQCREQNIVVRLKSKYLTTQKFWANYATAYNHCETDSLHLSRALPCFSASSLCLSHRTFLLDV